ncbi:hypothetical protein F5Y10DRAFT_288030 [Nemania abortiva]|nr:hypothetical protein F5Y10DRAFT_288030 [Nemania abortiva]
MLTPAFLNTLTFFYPVGNTPAASLTQYLPPNAAADILLLGCGDVRNILFTSHIDGRRMDITCCDNQKAVIARNILLLSLIIDSEDGPNDYLWSIYYHMYIDKKALDLLRSQAQKLYELSASMDTWQQSKYGSSLSFCDCDTLADLKRMWEFYSMEQEGDEFKRRLESALSKAKALGSARGGDGMILTGFRSAIPAHYDALNDVDALYQHYWEHGNTEMDADIKATEKYPNPTFLALEDESIVHYGTDPLLGFHLAIAYTPLQPGNPLFNQIKNLPRLERVVMVARMEFREWMASYRKHIPNLRIRFFVGDAISLTHTLQHKRTTTSSTAHLYRDRYSFQRLELDGPDYSSSIAPLDFDVIDTSNLCDHLGSLVLLAATSPLLRNHASSVLHTEVIARHHQTDQEVLSHMLCGHVPTVSALLDLFPVEFWTNTSPLSVGEEGMLDEVTSRPSGKAASAKIPQMFFKTCWKRPLCRPQILESCSKPISIQFDASQLAKVLYQVYTYMFRDEDYAYKLANLNPENFHKSSLVWYNRAGFATFLRLVKTRVTCNWDTAMDDLMALIENRPNAPMGKQYFQELYMYLYIMGVFSSYVLRFWQDRHENNIILTAMQALSIPRITPSNEKWGDLRDWKNIPSVVCVALKIPRNKLAIFTDASRSQMGTPYVHCVLEGSGSQGYWQNLFPACQLAFGDIYTRGEPYGDSFEIEVVEDSASWDGTSALIAVFYAPAFCLTREPREAKIAFGIHSTPASTGQFVSKLGLSMNVYETTLQNTAAVYFTRHGPNQTHFPVVPGFSHPSSTKPVNAGVKTSLIAGVDQETGHIVTFTGRLDIMGDGHKVALQDGCEVQKLTVSPCEVSIRLGEKTPLVLSFPVFVEEKSQRVRIARKSCYIEVIAKVATASEWMNYPYSMYPVLLQQGIPSNWNLPYIELQRCPVVDVSQSTKLKWLDIHISMMMSARERVLNRKRELPRSFGEEVRLDLKASLCTLFIKIAGLKCEKHVVFGLNNSENGGVHILILASNLRINLADRTVVLDCAVLPLHDGLMPRLANLMAALVSHGMIMIKVNDAEMKLWKHVLPAYVERCRTWTHRGNCEYAKANAVPLSTENGEQCLCACGNGNFPPNFISGVPNWKTLAKHSVRAAISPVFWAPFADELYRPDISEYIPTTAGAGHGPPRKGCASCGRDKQEDGSDLLHCGRCKKVNYCSIKCQRADWGKHKPTCA